MKIKLVDLKKQYSVIKSDLNKAISKVLNESNFIMGRQVGDFETAFAKFLGAKFVIGVSSGTDAIHLALKALGVKSGDEVITSPHTFTATVEPICWLDAKPVFVDIDPNTYCLDPGQIEAVITPKTKVIIPVHLYGYPADMQPIMKLARKYNLKVLEDAAQAHGAVYQGRKVGTIGDMAIFSFYPGKNLGAWGDAGAVVTNNLQIAEKVKLFRNHGRVTKYKHLQVGYGDRLDTLQAAILLAKLKHLARWNQRRQILAENYRQNLSNLAVSLPTYADDCQSVYHLFVIRTKYRDQLQKYLKTKGIETGIHYPIPLHMQPAYKFLGYQVGDFPQAETAAKEILSLPMYPEMTNQQVKYICQLIHRFFINRRDPILTKV